MEIKFTKDDMTLYINGTSQRFISDCATFHVGHVSITLHFFDANQKRRNLTTDIKTIKKKVPPSEVNEMIKYALLRICNVQGELNREYKRIVFTGDKSGRTMMNIKGLRPKTIKTISAHGGREGFNVACLTYPHKLNPIKTGWRPAV